MARRKCKGTQLSVFKGREAKLNRAILQILTNKSSQTIWDIKKQIANTRDLKHTRYHNINTRVKALEIKGFAQKIGEKETKAGSRATLYEATAKAYFALLIGSLCLDDLIDELDETTMLTFVSLIASRN